MAAAAGVSDLKVRYGDVEALKGVTFEVPERKLFGLLGPNGGGTTTLFRVLSTLLRPSGGTARIAGIDVVADPAAVRKKIGVVFQSPSLDKVLTVAANLRYQGALYGLSGSDLEARIDAMLKRLDLGDKARARVATLSGGQKRRVEIAKGILHKPEILLLDEPTTGLDPGARRAVWDWLAELRDGGASCIVTTHLMEEAERCDRLVILDQGIVVVEGTPEELKASIGCDIVTIEAADAPALADAIVKKFGAKTSVSAGTVRLEWSNAARLVPELASAFGPQIHSVKVGRPTLEDVFLQRTGRRLDDGVEPAPSGSKAGRRASR
jgi:ABC-2 type transport system ATP-binding protein